MSAQLWTGGLRVTAERLSNMLHRMDDWTPTWGTTSGSATPDYGNAFINCSYSQSGDLVVCHFEVVFGSTTSFGSGPTTADNWQFSLPVTAAASTQAIGEVEMKQNTNPARSVGRVRLTSTSVFVLEISSSRPDAAAITNLGVVDALSPWTWASGNAIRGTFEYEAA